MEQGGPLVGDSAGKEAESSSTAPKPAARHSKSDDEPQGRGRRDEPRGRRVFQLLGGHERLGELEARPAQEDAGTEPASTGAAAEATAEIDRAAEAETPAAALSASLREPRRSGALKAAASPTHPPATPT